MFRIGSLKYCLDYMLVLTVVYDENILFETMEYINE